MVAFAYVGLSTLACAASLAANEQVRLRAARAVDIAVDTLAEERDRA